MILKLCFQKRLSYVRNGCVGNADKSLLYRIISTNDTDNNGEERRGYYTVQGQDEGYVFHKIQQEILTYNASVKDILQQYKGAK